MTARPNAFDVDEPVFLWDPDFCRLVDANPAALRFWGEASRDELRNRVFAPDGAAARSLAASLEALDAGGVGEARLALRDGASSAAECSAAALSDGRRGLRVRLTAAGAGAAAALRAAAFEDAPRAMIVIGASGDLQARNAADRWAFPAASRTLRDRYVDPVAADHAIAAALAAGEDSRISTLTGRIGARRARVTLRRRTAPAGANAIIAEFVDATLEAAATPGFAEDGPEDPQPGPSISLAAMARIAHDLRSPLTAVKGFAEFMAISGDAIAEEKRATHLADIQTAAERMLALVDQIVALGAAEAQGAAPKLDIVDLGAVAREAARLAAPRIAATGARLTIDAPPGGAEIVCDHAVAIRIAQNLIDNAVRHGLAEGAGGEIGVAARPASDGGPAALIVRDDGRGMDAERLAQALRPFGAADKVGRAGGLGLSNCVRLARSMGATLEVETAPGEGLTARLVFAAVADGGG